jgi:hypothetical protein
LIKIRVDIDPVYYSPLKGLSFHPTIVKLKPEVLEALVLALDTLTVGVAIPYRAGLGLVEIVSVCLPILCSARGNT